MVIWVCNAFKKSFQITLVSCFVFGVFFQKLLKKNHVTRVFLIRYFFIYPQNKDHHSMVSWAWKNFVRRAKITILSWCFRWKNSKNIQKNHVSRVYLLKHFFYCTINKGCHYSVILIVIGFIKGTNFTPLSWLFLTKISKNVSEKPFVHCNMLGILYRFSEKKTTRVG